MRIILTSSYDTEDCDSTCLADKHETKELFSRIQNNMEEIEKLMENKKSSEAFTVLKDNIYDLLPDIKFLYGKNVVDKRFERVLLSFFLFFENIINNDEPTTKRLEVYKRVAMILKDDIKELKDDFKFEKSVVEDSEDN